MLAPDPVFEAIESHRRALAYRLAAIEDDAAFHHERKQLAGVLATLKILDGPTYGFPAHPKSECFVLIRFKELNPPHSYEVPADKIEYMARATPVASGAIK
jgi:hypothetical protein